MKNVWCKIFTNPVEQELNDFMVGKDIYDIHVVLEQPYRFNAVKPPNSFVGINSNKKT